MFSTDANLPSPRRRFPFDTSGGASPQPLPDCHLSRTAIPDPPISTADSSGSYPLLQTVFQGNIALRPKAMGRGRLASLSLICSRKAGYTAHSVHGSKPGSTAMQVQSGTVQRSLTTKGVRLCTISGLHSGRVRASHAIGTGPSAAGKKMPPPSIHPRLGVRSRHHGFHRYALQRIFRPFPDTGGAD